MRALCLQCSTVINHSKEGLEFYEKVSPVFNDKRCAIPPPTLCFDCRQQRKLSWRNERVLHKRTCDLSGKSILSIYRQDSPYEVYDFKEWFSDKWDAIKYGRKFDFNRPFFTQFAELHRITPLPSLFIDSDSENCDYTNLTKGNRNCYFIFAAAQNEDCYYTTYLQRNKNVSDCFFIFDSELCFDCIDCYNCYSLLHSQYCQNCNSSTLLHNCIGCSNCFCSASLVNKRYCMYNRQLTKEQYETKLKQVLSKPNWRKEGRTSLAYLLQSVPQNFIAGIKNENVSGDHVSFSKNSQFCFDCTYLEDCKFCTWLHQCKDCYDCYAWGLSGELGYESHLIGDNFYKVCFSDSCFGSVSELLYCRYCVNNCSNLFGCVGMRQKQYCILNRQYSREDYLKLVPKIIEHMMATGEWGQFFPEKDSPFGYNETVAQEYYPLTRQDVCSREWNWYDDLSISKGKETISWSKIPKDIKKIPANIIEKVVSCTECQRNYRFTSPEIQFYKRMNLGLPNTCFDCRYTARRLRRNPRKLWTRKCQKCNQEIMTSFDPKRPEMVYCESCYHKAIYG